MFTTKGHIISTARGQKANGLLKKASSYPTAKILIQLWHVKYLGSFSEFSSGEIDSLIALIQNVIFLQQPEESYPMFKNQKNSH